VGLLIGGPPIELVGQLESHGHAHEHPQAGLLGQQRAKLLESLVEVGTGGQLAHRLIVPGVEPAALIEGDAQEPLQSGRGPHHQLLSRAQPVGMVDRRHRGIELLVGVGAVGHSVHDHTCVAIALTSLSHGAGCGCKLPAAEIGPLLSHLPQTPDANVLVGYGTSDDAGVYRLRDDLALIHTVDFFTPIVDDPFDFGRIAATNALSDVYAMGGRPVSALNLVAFSLESLGQEVLLDILQGAAAVCGRAEVAIIGGHSIEDAEPKFGLAVTGVVHPQEVVMNSGGRPGDALVLTKPVGAGAITTALKRGSDVSLEEAVRVMTTLNRDGAAAAREAGVHGMTDVTGFGLLGHLHELALASGVAAEIDADAVPAIAPALELLEDPEAAVSGGTRRNRAHAEGFAAFDASVPEARRWLVCDAMTSGGLLAAVAADQAASMPGAVVGRLLEGEPGVISVR
jgi:selenide,water dikinase